MSVSDYQRVTRVATGLERILHERVETATRSVGFRSKKNFYRAVEQLTGLTLADFRPLPESRARDHRYVGPSLWAAGDTQSAIRESLTGAWSVYRLPTA